MPNLTESLRVLVTTKIISGTQQNLILLIAKSGWRGCHLTGPQLAADPSICREYNRVQIAIRRLRDTLKFIKIKKWVELPIDRERVVRQNPRITKVRYPVYVVDKDVIESYCTRVHVLCVVAYDLKSSSLLRKDSDVPGEAAGCAGSRSAGAAKRITPNNGNDRNTTMSDTSTRPSPTENTSVEGFGLSERKKTAVQKLVSISDYNRAEKLFDALRAKNKVVTKQRRISKWAEEFYHLRCMILDSEIEVVLEWYCANIGGEFVPWAHSAKSFRDDFPRIKDQMEMQRRINPAPLEVTETAKRILTDVQDWFSGQNAVRLPQAVQKSLDGAKSFFLRLQELKATETLAKQLVERWKFYPYLVREWFQVLSDTIFKSPDTYAKITNYAFSLECTYADTFLAKIAGDTTGRPDNWNKLKERINGRA